MDRILCVGNWESDVGYAWWLMERFWEAIALKYPGRVTISYKKLGNVPQRLVDAGANFIEHDFLRGNDIDLVRRHGFRYLYLTDKPYFSRAYASLRLVGVRRIIMHDHMPGERTPAIGPKRLAKTIANRVRPCTADAYIACSEQVLQRFNTACCLPPERCHLARNGIDLNASHAPVDIRAELDIPRTAVLVVSCGRATKYKGVQHIIRAASSTNAYFVHCGDGPDLLEFEALIAQRGLRDRFFMLGKRSDVPGIMASADIAVHASSGEGLSLAILEFQRAGLPLVLPDLPTVTQTVDQTCALLYPHADHHQLAAHLRLLIDRADLRRRMGAASREKAQQYSLDHTVAAVLGVFEALRI